MIGTVEVDDRNEIDDIDVFGSYGDGGGPIDVTLEDVLFTLFTDEELVVTAVLVGRVAGGT